MKSPLGKGFWKSCLAAALVCAAFPAAGAATHRLAREGRYWAFTPQAPEYQATLGHGKFGARIGFQHGPNFQWSYELYASTTRGAIGPMVEDADLYVDGKRIKSYHDHHGPVSPRYFVHSSWRGPVRAEHQYMLAIIEHFPIRVGQRVGVGTVGARFYFVISLA
jgi:hypothetical protein